MTADHAQREPTMEEILASIRRIISEEDKPAEAGGEVLDLQPAAPTPAPVAEAKPAPAPVQAPPPPKPEPVPEPVVAKAPPPPPKEEYVEPVAAAPQRPLEEDLLIVEKSPDPAPEPVHAAPPAEPRPVFRSEPTNTLTSAPVANAAAGALGRLMGSIVVSSGNTLDDVVRELLKPMLKEWLDANLPQLVEAEVGKEIDRIRRLAR